MKNITPIITVCFFMIPIALLPVTSATGENGKKGTADENWQTFVPKLNSKKEDKRNLAMFELLKSFAETTSGKDAGKAADELKFGIEEVKKLLKEIFSENGEPKIDLAVKPRKMSVQSVKNKIFAKHENSIRSRQMMLSMAVRMAIIFGREIEDDDLIGKRIISGFLEAYKGTMDWHQYKHNPEKLM